MSFLYWIPQANSVTSDQLRDHGLAYAFDGKHTVRGCESGPDGQRGLVVVAGNNQDGKLGYYQTKQTWRRIPSSECWCGYYTDERPTPEQLARQEQIPGQWLALDDGNRWLVPKARRMVEVDEWMYPVCLLPTRLSLDADGMWKPGEVKPRYEKLWQLATQYEQAFTDAVVGQEPDENGMVTVAFEEPDELAVSTLQVNYRVSAVELDLLGIYDYLARRQIINILMDQATWDAWLKKKNIAADQAGGSS
jgi:hypothetical protein